MSLSKFGTIEIPFSVFYFLLNIPLTLLVYKYVGHRFTIFSVLQYSLTSLFTELLPTFPITSDMLLIAVFGGIVGGLAISIALRSDASSGGTDFIAIYASTKYNAPTWSYVMYFNAAMLIVAGVLFGWEQALYSIIYQFCSTQVVQGMHLRYKLNSLFIITEKPEERTALSTFRGVGANLAQLVIGVLGPVIIYTTDVDGAQVIRGGGSIFPVVAGIFSVCAILCYVICYKCTTERVRIEKDPDAPKVTLLQTFATIFSSRAMLGIIGAALFLMLSQLLISGLNMYLYADYFGDVKAFSSYTFINIMLSLVLAGFVGRITGRMGKKEAAAVATAFTGAVYLVLFALKLTNPWIYMISSAIGFLGVNFFNLVIWANITDVIDDAEVRNGKREDGTIYAEYPFARKVGQALAGGLSGYAMGLIGYESAAKVQTAEVLNGLYTISTLVPALLFFCVTFMLLVVYPLNKKKVEENSEILQKRRAAR